MNISFEEQEIRALLELYPQKFNREGITALLTSADKKGERGVAAVGIMLRMKVELGDELKVEDLNRKLEEMGVF